MCDIHFIQLTVLLWLKLLFHSCFSTTTTINTVTVSYFCVTNLVPRGLKQQLDIIAQKSTGFLGISADLSPTKSS